jgi:hypothetical protein
MSKTNQPTYITGNTNAAQPYMYQSDVNSNPHHENGPNHYRPLPHPFIHLRSSPPRSGTNPPDQTPLHRAAKKQAMINDEMDVDDEDVSMEEKMSCCRRLFV